ncbi:MAG: exonuclease domain-containing protein, partial [Planctomycetota bacterium]
MSTLKIAVIDVETTGLSPWRHYRIVELAVVVVTPDGVVQQEYETLVNPERDMGPTRIHRIAAGDVV